MLSLLISLVYKGSPLFSVRHGFGPIIRISKDKKEMENGSQGTDSQAKSSCPSYLIIFIK